MKITVVTLFPDMFRGFLEDSIVQRAQNKGAVEIEFINPRDFAKDAHRSVDDRPFGGGPGMVLMVEPLSKAIEQKRSRESYVVGTSARGTRFTQTKARALAKKQHLIIVAGHYEGYDERLRTQFDEEVSIGDFILTGGELVAACIIDAVVRLQKGVLKKTSATEEESFFEVDIDELIRAVGNDELLVKLAQRSIQKVTLLEYPQYTRPQDFNGQQVPDVLVSGDPKKIRVWQLQRSYEITRNTRIDMLTA